LEEHLKLGGITPPFRASLNFISIGRTFKIGGHKKIN